MTYQNIKCLIHLVVDKLKLKSQYICRLAINHNEMVNIFVFGNYAEFQRKSKNFGGFSEKF